MAYSTFYAGGRRRRIYRRRVGACFSVRFQLNGKDFVRSLGTTVESAAKERAKILIEAAVNGDSETFRRLKVRSDFSTLREIGDVYIRNFGTDARRMRTARNNVGALEKIVRLGAGVSLDVARANVLTGSLVRKFEAEDAKRILHDESGFVLQESELRVRTSINSIVRQARSIFKRSHMHWFDELSLPTLEEFRQQGISSPDRPRPRPLDTGVIEALNAAAPKLAAENPRCYIAHLLFSRLGMRNVEQKAALKTWIVRTPNLIELHGIAGKLGIIYRPEEEFKPKRKTERWIPISAATLALIDKYWEPSPDGDFLVPAGHKTDRANIVDDHHSAWCGQWIRDRSKVSYELRRYAGSLVYRKTGKIEHVQQFLGHAHIKTTLEWYWYLLDETPALDETDFIATAAPEPGR